jgi:beta-phosphoglucomutase-like phosphatase (HAD superfamily)
MSGGCFQGAIFDVDGVLVGSPHGPEEGRLVAFADALRFALAVKQEGVRVAAISSSSDAWAFLDRIRLDTFAAEQRLDYPYINPGLTLLQLFDVALHRPDMPHPTPYSVIFSAAAAELAIPPGACFLVAGAAAAIEAAGARGMAAVGVARTGDEEVLSRAGADLVVATLDDVSVEALGDGRLQFHSTFAERRRRQRERPPSKWALMSLSAGGSFGDGGVPGCGRRCAGQAEAVRGRLSAFEESLRALRRHASEHLW